MFPPAAADAARQRSLDVVAVQEVLEIRGLSDPDLFAIAQFAGRVLVTENARDILPAEMAWRRKHGSHQGLILTSNRTFPRHDVRRFVRRFTVALAGLDGELTEAERSFVRWLG